MSDLKKRLAVAIKEEADRLPNQSAFGESNEDSKYESELCVKYLITGEKPHDWKDYDMLYSVVNDLYEMCDTYDVEY